MQKISLFHLFILQLQSILESRHQTGHTFLAMLTLRFFSHLLVYVNLCQHAKNQLILEIKLILKSRDQIDHTHFWPLPTKKVLINFYFVKPKKLNFKSQTFQYLLKCKWTFFYISDLLSSSKQTFHGIFFPMERMNQWNVSK